MDQRTSRRPRLLGFTLSLSLSLLLCLSASAIYADNLSSSSNPNPYDPSLNLLLDDWPIDNDYSFPYDNELDPDAGKTDRYIVKYQENKAESFKSKLSNDYDIVESLSLDTLLDSLQSLSILPNTNSSRGEGDSSPPSISPSSRYPNLEVITLSEKLLPSELEAVLVLSGAYDDILYIQPD